MLIGGTAGDLIDGDAGNDLIFGDQVSLDGRTILDLFHSLAHVAAPVPAGKLPSFGDDYITGGAGDDRIFGQLGNDVLLGDGAHRGPGRGRLAPPRRRRPARRADLARPVERQTDGNDSIEGGGGDDVLFGGLGNDNLIGGSSSLYTLVRPDQRPDGDDYIFGGAGTRSAANTLTRRPPHRRRRDRRRQRQHRPRRRRRLQPRRSVRASRCSTAPAPTRSTARPATTRSSAAPATTACSATRRGRRSSAAPATTGSPAAPATTRSSVRTATT